MPWVDRGEEAETHLIYDYEAKEIIIYTTRVVVFDEFVTKLKGLPGVKISRHVQQIHIPMEFTRDPTCVLKSMARLTARKGKRFGEKAS